MKTKEFALDVKDVSEAGVVEGYGSTFGGSPDSYGDIVVAGAFADSLVKHRREGSMPLMLFGHNSNEVPIGTWDEMAEDGKGLWVKGTLSLDDPFAARVHTALKRKAMRGMSIGYQVNPGGAEPDPKRPGVTLLKSLEIWEVSIVNFPANRRSLIDNVKSDQFARLRDRLVAGDLPSEREFEKGMRDAFELSNSEAERVARLFFKVAQGEPEKDANDAAALLKALRG